MLRAVAVCFALLTAAAAQAQTPASTGRLEGIKKSGVVKIAYRADAKPFSFVTDTKAAAGFSIDLCKLVAKSIAADLGRGELKIEWVPVTLQTRFSAVATGKADMECGSSTVTLGRMKEVDFSNVVFVETTGLIVRKADGIQRFADLAGKKIAVIAGTTNEQAVNRQLRQQNVNATVVPVKSRDEGVAAVESGSAQAFASDKLLLVGANMKNPDALQLLPDDLSMEPYAIALPRGDWALRLAVNKGLSQVYRSGQIVPVFASWFNQVGLQMGPLMQTVYALGALQD